MLWARQANGARNFPIGSEVEKYSSGAMTAGQSAGAAKPTSTNAQWMRAHLGLLLTTIRLRYLYVSIVVTVHHVYSTTDYRLLQCSSNLIVGTWRIQARSTVHSSTLRRKQPHRPRP